MRHCNRCGIDVPDGLTGKICDDCADVTEERKGSVIRIVEQGQGRGYRVSSGRKGGARTAADLELLRVRVKALTERRLSANRIAIEVGVSTRTVQRVRSTINVRGLARGSDGWRNPEDRTKPPRGTL